MQMLLIGRGTGKKKPYINSYTISEANSLSHYNINWRIYRSLDETDQRLGCFNIPEDRILNSLI